MAYYSVVKEEKRTFGGCLVMSGYMPNDHKTESIAPCVHETPFLQCHGTHDPMVKLDFAKASYTALREKLGHENNQFKTYSMGHESCEDELRDVQDWIFGILFP